MDDQKGYVSLTHGQPPLVKQFKTFQDEVTFLFEHLKGLANQGTPLSSVCVVARTKRVLDGYTRALKENGFDTYEIKRNVAEQANKPGIRLATMHRVKGLEFEHIVIVSANDGIIPLDKAVREPEDDVAARNAETGERSLLYVALTRARRSAAITCYGRVSPFLT